MSKFEIAGQTLHHADWRDVLPMLADASVDLLLTDPPYGTTAIEWDKKVEWDLFWREIKRVCKPNAVMVIFAAGKFVNELINSNPKDYRYELIWEKSVAVGFLDANQRPLRAHEQMLVFTRIGFRNATYNPQNTKGMPHKTGGVSNSSNPCDTVLDPFSGSGTTLVASMIAGRCGLGSEADPDYFAVARQRLIDTNEALI